jgi:nitroreductase
LSALTKDDFLSVMRRRYACKLFSRDRRLTDSDTDYILECARLSPSSYGLEHWQLFAVRSDAMIAKFRAACFDQDAVGTASLVVVAMCRRGDAYDPSGEFVRGRGSRFPGGLDVFVADYEGYYRFLKENALVDHWARSQCYIACANMMTGAAAAGIESCAIEGYDNALVLEALGLDPDSWETGIVTSFGYAANADSREKIRMPLEGIATYV